MRRAFFAAGLFVLCSAILGATLFREQVVQAAQSIMVNNTSSNPVPVSLLAPNPVPVSQQAPTLRAFAETIDGGNPDHFNVTVPAGVVVTDVIVSSGDPDCTLFSIGLFDNPGGAAPLVLLGNASQNIELHLQTGVRSTDDQPLTIGIRADCVARIFWSGYEG